MRTSLFAYAMLPLHALALATGAKSFCDNPLIGSSRLNRKGLHVARVALAEAMADRRRRRLAHLVDPADRAALDRDGFVVVREALPPTAFAALKAELAALSLPAREMRQGAAVTRFIDPAPASQGAAPTLRAFLRCRRWQGLLRYAAAADADPVVYLHTVLTDPARGLPDPQTAFHSDTFHATSKAWLFLDDVAAADGAFSYVPGSHRATPERLAWERAQSQLAATAADRLHARGSLRVSLNELVDMGFGPPVTFDVPANTLVVADTHGFHARGPSLRPSVRPAVYGSLRRNPFLPWTGLDPFDLPGLQGRKAALFGAYLDLCAAVLRSASRQPVVGLATVFDEHVRV